VIDNDHPAELSGACRERNHTIGGGPHGRPGRGRQVDSLVSRSAPSSTEPGRYRGHVVRHRPTGRDCDRRL
jgi:hypothetical protein